jgi:CubicO group peptidase (beta-lactamase class C family)
MSDHPRSLPDRANLRYLKIEAKRRLGTGEFATLHDAQLAVAREHGQSSWAVLKQLVESRPASTAHARAQLGWIASRFADAAGPGWIPPTDHELREHFHEQFLNALPAERLLPMLTALAPRLRADVVLAEDTPTHVLVQLDAGQLQAVVEPTAPHRLVGLRAYGTGKIVDPRLATPATDTTGDVPTAAIDVATRACTELGLVGLALAGADPSDARWALARGWANLDPVRPLTNRHPFPASSITELVTAVAVLRLIADGHLTLDTPANRLFDTIRLTDSTVTVRELLSHTGGVDTSSSTSDPAVVACGGERGRYAHSDGGYAALGQLVTDITRSPYPAAITRLVLEPLDMNDSFIPTPSPRAEQVTGYTLTPRGTLEPAPGQLCTVPAASGLWTTASDLVRFGRRWHTLLPRELADEALTPQAELSAGSHIGLGWQLDRTGTIAGRTGSEPGASASLVVHVRAQRVHVALTNRKVPVEPINGRILRALG